MSGAKIIPLQRPVSSVRLPVRWIGGVVQPRGLRRDGKPLRVAAWITSGGVVLEAADVDGHGPTVLREMLNELLATTTEDKRPGRITVWPSVRAAFRDIEYPHVVVERDRFLTVVIEDDADAGFPWGLSVRRARPPR